jgi:hypothetical protein
MTFPTLKTNEMNLLMDMVYERDGVLISMHCYILSE